MPAEARRVYDGRDAQGLHCAAMLIVITAILQDAGELSPNEVAGSAAIGTKILMQLPGTDSEKITALRQRAIKIVETRSGEQLAKEFRRSVSWCERNFLR